MAKKSSKRKQKDPQFPERDSGTTDSDHGVRVQQCPHVRQGVDKITLRKNLKQGLKIGVCSGCGEQDSAKSEGAATLDATITASTDIMIHDELEGLGKKDDTIPDLSEQPVWLCLYCGHQGCGRKTDTKHAYRHFKTPRTGCHSVAVNTTTWLAWCYECDTDVLPEQSGRLLEAVEFVKKLSGKTCKTPAHSRNASLVIGLKKAASVMVEPGATDFLPVNDSAVKIVKKKESKAELTQKDLKNLKNSQQSTVLASLAKVKGLNNLGNTCFFNSVMQVMSQTHLLSHMIDLHNPEETVLTLHGGQVPVEKEGERKSSRTLITLEDIQVTLKEKKPLTLSFSSFLKDMHSQGKAGTHGGAGSTVVNPGHLLNQIRKKSPVFEGYEQQDSQELLRHFLDGLKTDELERNRAGILRKFNLPEKAKRTSVDSDFRTKLKFYDREASHTLVDQIFSGQLMNTLVCETCKEKSQRLEQFLDLSLSIAEEKPTRPVGKKKAEAVAEDDDDDAVLNCFKRNAGPTKHQKKKEKKAAKIQKKKQKSVKPPSFDEEPEKIDLEKNENPDEKEAKELSDAEEGDKATQDGSDGGDGASRDESDADIEDNEETESFTSRTVSSQQDADSLNIQEEEVEAVNKQLDGLDLAGDPGRESQTKKEKRPNTFPKPEKRPRNVESEGMFTPDVSFDRRHISDDESHISDVSYTKKKAQWYARSLTAIAPRYQAATSECSIRSCLNQFTAPELLFGSNSVACDNCTKKHNNSKKSGGDKVSNVYSPARKQLLLFVPPAVLTIHLKRFMHCGTTLKKVNKHVEFPLLLDLAPFCSAAALGTTAVSSSQKHIIYSLYGVVEHSGRLNSGHYTACVKARPMDGDSKQFLNKLSYSTTDIDRLINTITERVDLSEDSEMPDILKGLPEAKETKSKDLSDSDLEQLGVNLGSAKWYNVSDTQVSATDVDRVLRSQAYLLFYERVY